jgi:hypothetical protein
MAPQNHRLGYNRVQRHPPSSATKGTGLQGALATVFTRPATVPASSSRSILLIPVYRSEGRNWPGSFVANRTESGPGCEPSLRCLRQPKEKKENVQYRRAS